MARVVSHRGHGRFELFRVGPMTIDRTSYEPYVSLHLLGSERYAT